VARVRRESVSIFNFSFVDILATTIGVLIFVMVMVLLNATGRISAEGLKAQVEHLRGQAREHQGAVKEWDKKAKEEEARRRGYQAAATTAAAAAQAADKHLKYQKRQAQKLAGEARQLGQKAAALRGTVAALKDRARRLANQNREEVPFRIPRQRATTKRPVYFECAGGRVYLLAFGGRLEDKNYSAKSLLDATLITRKKSAVGETIAGARGRGSSFVATLNRASKRTHFAHFIVREDSFDLFRQLRGLLWERRYEYNWQAFRADENIISGPSRRGRRVQR